MACRSCAPSAERMRVVTYNIRGGLGLDGRRDLGRIGSFLREAEVAGLQEVHQRLPQSGLSDQPRALARATGMACLFGPALAIGPGKYGNAVLSTLAARRRAIHRLPGGGEPRAALEVELEMEGRTLTMICTHFGLSTAARVTQAASLAAAVRKVRAPVMVVGDLNALPDAPELQTLLATGLRHAASPIEPTFPSDDPRHRIDYILLSPELVCRECRVLSSLASDHLPVLADIGWAESDEPRGGE
jgi:endonuclease/exonuclease/phosphatase family metal-dependent hydrolase